MSEWGQISVDELRGLVWKDQRECRVRIGTAAVTVLSVGGTAVAVAGAAVTAPASRLSYDLLEAAGAVIERPAPPKPRIPTGLGAVIQIGEQQYVLTDPADPYAAWFNRNRLTGHDWISTSALQTEADAYGFTVLSEGVSVGE